MGSLWSTAWWAIIFVLAMGCLRRHPLTITIKKNRIVECESKNAELREEFWAYTHTDENSDRVGEFAIGTNVGIERVIGNILQDEKFPGIHIAFGNPYGEHTGAPWIRRRISTWSDCASTSGWAARWRRADYARRPLSGRGLVSSSLGEHPDERTFDEDHREPRRLSEPLDDGPGR